MEPIGGKKDFKDGDLFEDGGKVKDEAITNDPAVIAARKQAAMDFYQKKNPNMSPDDIKSHINGIDFTKPVEIIKIPPGGSGPKGNELY